MSEPANTTAPATPALKCWPWSHKWTAWELTPTEYPRNSQYSNGNRYERRRCLRCGKTQQNWVGPLP